MKSLGVILICPLLAFPAPQEQAQAVRVQLIPEVLSVQPGTSFYVAVRIQMEEGWHTYWKNPGDSGLATTVQWKLPAGFSAREIEWPYPNTFMLGLDINYGYDEEVWLLTEITPPSSLKMGASVSLAATVKWLACLEECIPGRADVLVKIPIQKEKPEADPVWSESFRKTREKIPAKSSAWETSASLEGNIIRLSLSPPAEVKMELKDVTFFPEKGELIEYAEPQILKKAEALYILELKKSKFSRKWPARIQGVLLSGEGWGEAHGKPAIRINVKLDHVNPKPKELKK